MAWDFETDADVQAELDWIEHFVREEVEPLEHVLGSPWNIHDPLFKELVRPLQAQVRERRLWACHLGPELGGPGYGQVRLALINEILGRALFGPIVFGCQARTPATAKSSRTMAPSNKNAPTCNRCWTAKLSPVSR